ncbi:hypothetical protein TVAG_170150 [Trichomonas vaginalis G3]|uniref:Uncharacterized protein n=1 Tax=Trichomonas vaginalis (strain ATCC PRA-98 / G3) TaxID=412133 RepID=A2DPF8_TRIV3|nr:hypothetical protein TVAGG3_0680760 [Trichomonas vaginalis G3]EAY17702.1 hypothetical protein TVAG_170150 [Trichomonas vaginalis G3]KAI5507893.1 hypothetical protein TVAGG3_0680760 [Trichomonas vaginalis G3]|eukprot:XP_001329837.1 hypothetical protein [Trichomonas vaginalis G3]
MPKLPTLRPRIVLFDRSNNGNVSGKIICIGKHGYPLHTETFNCYKGSPNQKVEPRGVDFSEAEQAVKKFFWTLQSQTIPNLSSSILPVDTSLIIPLDLPNPDEIDLNLPENNLDTFEPNDAYVPQCGSLSFGDCDMIEQYF